MKHIAAALAALCCVILIAASGQIVVTGQLLAYQEGFVFFTSGDGFRVSPHVVIDDAATGTATTIAPGPRVWARATFDADGTVVKLDLSRKKLAPEGSFDQVGKFAVALSTPVPNPDLVPHTPAPDETRNPNLTYSGKPVLVTFIVQVPPNTPLTASVYITTDASGWNAQAIPMDRVDALHYRITRRIPSGTVFRYLYDRGSLQASEIAENGLQRTPRELVLPDADVRAIHDIVYQWLDTATGLQNVQPNTMPSPYNPGPFVNLPNGMPSPNPCQGKKPPC